MFRVVSKFSVKITKIKRIYRSTTHWDTTQAKLHRSPLDLSLALIPPASTASNTFKAGLLSSIRTT